jgi:hypothetical protein
MTDLSPAAQAIASAYDDTPEKETGNHRYLWLAAALRAAADFLAYETQIDDPMMTTVRVVDVDDLLIIANELGQQS